MIIILHCEGKALCDRGGFTKNILAEYFPMMEYGVTAERIVPALLVSLYATTDALVTLVDLHGKRISNRTLVQYVKSLQENIYLSYCLF